MLSPKARRVLAVTLVLASAPLVGAAEVTGPSDPNASILFQGADALTFIPLGYTIGLGANDLHVYTNTWTDPTGLVFGTLVPGHENVAGYGHTYDKLGYGYTTDGSDSVANGNARNYKWVQNIASNNSSNVSLDLPWTGSIYDLGAPSNQAVVFPIVDHGPLPQEAIEYTVYLGNDPNSTSIADWTLAKLDSVYLEGWESDATSLADGFTTVWRLPGSATFRYVSVNAVGSQALAPYTGNEDEIDAVAGLNAQGGSSAVPLPSSATLGTASLLALLIARRLRRKPAAA